MVWTITTFAVSNFLKQKVQLIHTILMELRRSLNFDFIYFISNFQKIMKDEEYLYIMVSWLDRQILEDIVAELHQFGREERDCSLN